MAMIYDANKKLLSVSDIYPEEAQLQKGEHTVVLLIRHDNPQLLETFRDLPLIVERKLKEPITVPVYPTNSDAVRGTNAVKDFVLYPGFPTQMSQNLTGRSSCHCNSLNCSKLSLRGITDNG